MSGSIRQRGPNSWELRVYGGTDPDTGRRRWLTRTVRGSRTEAQRELVSLAAVANVAPVVGARTTVAELLERWFTINVSNWAPTTVRNTRSIIDRQLTPGLGRPVGARADHRGDRRVLRVAAHRRPSGRQAAVGRRRSPGAWRVAPGACAGHALGVALGQSGVLGVAAPRRAGRDAPTAPVEVHQLLDQIATDQPRFHLFLVLAATTGARRGQLLALRWADVDLASGSLAFQRALVEGPNGPVLVPTKTRRSHRVALDPASVELLHACYDEAVAHCGDELDDAFVFAYDDAGRRPWKPNWVTKRFIDARRRARLDHFRLHDLRHFMATQMLSAGVAVPVVSARLAHARASTTLNVYAHAVPGGDADAAQFISRVVGVRPPALTSRLPVRHGRPTGGSERLALRSVRRRLDARDGKPGEVL